MTTDLFTPFRLGGLDLQNRIVMAPMTRSRAIGGIPNDLMREYYVQRASAGLIVTEGTAPAPEALGYARIPGLFSDAQVEGWKKVTGGVHAAGPAFVFAQLMHTGRIGHALNLPEGARVLAPSATTAAGAMWTDAQGQQPHPEAAPMTADELRVARDSFGLASANAARAGFDGVELHGANGYLLEQFMNPETNQRTDEYGGSAERRVRFVVESMASAAAAIGAARVGIRLSPYNTYNDLSLYEDIHVQYVAVARAARELGLAYLHLVGSPNPSFGATAAAMKDAFGGPIILNGGMDRARAESAIAEGRADLVSFARSFISNPDLPRRFRENAPLVEASPATFYTPGPEGYVDYPALR